MATSDVGSLFISLGLNLSDLETDLIAADRTVTQNIGRLNRAANVIRLRSQVEIAGLDETADAERILQIRTDTLNQLMAIQRDRVRILNAELQNLTAAHGENATATQQVTIRLERERLALANLERESRRLSETSGETNDVFGELSNLLPEIPTKLGAAQMALGALTAGIGAAGAATKELLDEFRELQNQSYELNMSFPDTRNFLREMRLAGGDIGDYEGFIRGITDAWVKGEWDDPEFIALRKYGAEIVDATGRLKDFKDISEEVYQAWLKADEAGEGIEFLQLVGGESGIRDAIQLFQRLKEAREDAAKISKAGIDAEQLHKLDRSMNLVTEQASELKAALGNIFVPTAQAAAERFFNAFQKGTDYLNENKDALQKLQFVAVGIFDNVAPKIAEVLNPRLQFQALAEDFKKLFPDEKLNPDSPAKKILDVFSAEKINSGSPISKTIETVNEKYKAFKDELEDINTVTGKIAQGLAALSEAQKKHGDALSQYGDKRVQQFRNELEDLKIELDFGDDEYGKALAQQDLWKKRESIYKNYLSDEERAVIDEVDKLRRQLIEQEHADKIAEAMKEHFDNAADIEYEMTHTAFEKQLRDIELWEQAQLEKRAVGEETADIIAAAAAKEAQAFEDEMNRIKGKLQSLEDKIFEQEHSQYENDLRRIEQERARYHEEFQSKGILTPEWRAQIERWYQNAVGKLNQRASESRKSGSDYTKPPEGTMQSGGNGIMVVGADQIIDDGLIRGQQQQIGLLVNENRLRAQLAPKLSQEARDKIAAIQATKELTAAQKELLQKQQSAASGFQFIEGDKVTNLPIIDYPQIAGEQFATPPNVLQEFAASMQETVANLDPLKEAANAQKAFADSTKAFPPEYFKNLADGAKAVSEMQGILTRSTMALIKEQDKLAKALSSLPTVNTGKNTDNQQTDGMLSLSTSTQEVRQAQNLLARTSRETALNLRDISDIPPQARIAQKDERLKFGFDMDAAGLAAGLASLGLMGATAPISAPVIGGVAVASLLAGLAKGSYDETTAAKEQYDARVNPLPPGVDLSVLETPLSTIDKNVQSVLQNMQDDTETSKADRLQEIFGTLPNIEEYTKSILLELQSLNEVANTTVDKTPPAEIADYMTPLKSIETNVQSILQQFKSMPALDANISATETTVSFETVVTPLNNIHSVLGNILTALTNQQPPQINVSPNNNINLGGAYVFDNAMKNQLVNDITSIIVDEITVAVQQGKNRSSYGFGN